MSKIHILPIGFLGMLLPLVALADPLISFPQGDFSCTVEVTPRVVPKPDTSHPERRYSPVLKKIGVTQVGKIRRDISVFSDNSVSQLWDLPEKKVSVMESNTGGKDLYLLRGFLRDHARSPLLSFDAQSFSWLTAKGVDPQAVASGQPLHYQAQVVVSDPGAPLASVLYQAWIDPKTLLPQKLDDGEATYVLTFSTSPPGGLVVPPNIQSEFDRYEAAYAVRPHR